MQGLEWWQSFLFFFFLKNSQSYIDLEPINLKVELARDIIIPNIYVKLYWNPLINVGTRAMKKFVFFFVFFF